jgi:hypothetical protein
MEFIKKYKEKAFLLSMEICISSTLTAFEKKIIF